jgi:hypothetical protein
MSGCQSVRGMVPDQSTSIPNTQNQSTSTPNVNFLGKQVIEDRHGLPFKHPKLFTFFTGCS